MDKFRSIVSKEIIQLAIGKHQIQINLHPKGSISVESRMKLFDSRGKIVDQWEQNLEYLTSKLPVILGQVIQKVKLHEEELIIRTDGGFSLVITTNNAEGYESVVIQPGDIIL